MSRSPETWALPTRTQKSWRKHFILWIMALMLGGTHLCSELGVVSSHIKFKPPKETGGLIKKYKCLADNFFLILFIFWWQTKWSWGGLFLYIFFWAYFLMVTRWLTLSRHQVEPKLWERPVPRARLPLKLCSICQVFSKTYSTHLQFTVQTLY